MFRQLPIGIFNDGCYLFHFLIDVVWNAVPWCGVYTIQHGHECSSLLRDANSLTIGKADFIKLSGPSVCVH